MENPKILIVEFGGQYTKLIEQRLRENGFRSAVLPPKQAEKWIKNNKPKGIILGGSRHSVNAPGAPTISPKIFDSGIPILGICYGSQYIVKALGGTVVTKPVDSEYGPTESRLNGSVLFGDLPKKLEVLASHGDTAHELPSGFEAIAHTPTGAVAGIENKERRIWGLQFHPESQDTPLGKFVLTNFARICDCTEDWKPQNLIREIQSEIDFVTRGGRAVIGMSGGRDSTILAELISPKLGARLRGYCIDGGQFRENELDEVRTNAEVANVHLHIISAKDIFERVWKQHLRETPDPQVKRKIFKYWYRRLIQEASASWYPTHFIQGTLAPDVIESGKTGGDLIKSHHNIGIKIKGCKSLHPFQNLFKYEVTALGKERELPDFVTLRQPFPGPGLFVRTPGRWPTREPLDVLRWGDARTKEICVAHDVYKDISQLVVYLAPGQSLGVKGDERSYEYAIVVRPMVTVDFMTAEAYDLPKKTEQEITRTLTRHKQITRVLWDYTPKPPGTIEPE
jgi:GMP synthase (glutamine-hydrolysing)